MNLWNCFSLNSLLAAKFNIASPIGFLTFTEGYLLLSDIKHSRIYPCLIIQQLRYISLSSRELMLCHPSFLIHSRREMSTKSSFKDTLTYCDKSRIPIVQRNHSNLKLLRMSGILFYPLCWFRLK